MKTAPAPATPPAFMKVKDIATRLGVSEKHVYFLCDNDEIDHLRVGKAIRITPQQFEDYVRRISHGPKAAAAV